MIDTAAVLAALDGLGFIKQLYPQSPPPTARGEVRILCPFHQDTNPSCDFNIASKTYRCLSCQAAGTAVDLLAAKTGRPRHEAAQYLAAQLGIAQRSVISSQLVEEYYGNLRANKEILAELEKRKGLSIAAVDRWRLGWLPKERRLAIPIRDETGAVVNLRRYDLLKIYPPEKKYLNTSGHGQLRLYPLNALSQDEVHLAEGELKMMVLTQHGVNAITATGGAAGWKDEWDVLFAGKRVYIVYDIDDTGRARARAYARRLSKVAKDVYDVLLPLDKNQHPKGGAEDYFAFGYSAKDYQNLCTATVKCDPRGPAAPLVDDTEYETTLGSASKAQYYLKKVVVPVIVSAKDTAPYIVPKTVCVRCTRDAGDFCAGCPVFGASDPATWSVPADDPDLLRLVDVTAKQQEAELRELIGIPDKCRIAELDFVETHNVEEVRLVPQVNTAPDAPTGGEQVVAKAYYVGHGIETNATYAARGRVAVEPTSQHATLLIHNAEPNVDNLSNFSPTDDELAALEVFRPTAWTVEALEARLTQLYQDLEWNVTRIYQRRDLHVLMDLVWHSALYIPLGAEPSKGWLDAIVIGDSGQGKTECALRLLKHYKLGERVDMKGASVAGLKGGLQETQGRWFVTWGVIPLNDRRMAILEEVKGCAPEVLQALTDMRSSGVAELVKIERRRAFARTRLLWITNPRSDRRVETYSFGVQTVKELMGSLEDVRRFDVALVVASNEVDPEVIAASEAEEKLVPHIYTSELCQRLILWAWSRKVSQVRFEPDAKKAILSLAVEQSKRYSAAIPLVEPADHRLKLARLATALAARTFSSEGDTLVIRECHARWIAAWLDKVYTSRFVGYADFSKTQQLDATLGDTAIVKAALAGVPYGQETLRGLLRATEIRLSDFSDWTGLDKDSARELLATLVRANALQRRRDGYYKTGAFIELLRGLDNGTLPTRPEHAKDF